MVEILPIPDDQTKLIEALDVAGKASLFLKPFCEADPEAKAHFTELVRGLASAGSLAQGWAGPAPPSPPPGSVSISKPLILMIDDEDIILEMAKSALESAGYTFIGSGLPFDALEIFRKLKDTIALVILDYTLPIMNGAELFAELRAIAPDVRVMLSSGYSEKTEVQNMLSRGLRGFLPKPYTAEKLISHVQMSLMGAESDRQRKAAAPQTP